MVLEFLDREQCVQFSHPGIDHGGFLVDGEDFFIFHSESKGFVIDWGDGVGAKVREFESFELAYLDPDFFIFGHSDFLVQCLELLINFLSFGTTRSITSSIPSLGITNYFVVRFRATI